jgi:hypothetical protein
MSLSTPDLTTRTRVASGRPQYDTNLQFSRILPQIQAWMTNVAKELESIRTALSQIVVPTTGPSAPTNAWFDIVSAPAVTVNPSDSPRQQLIPVTDLTISLPGVYAGDDTLRLVIAQGATPRVITFATEWALPEGVGVEVTALTYTSFEWEFRAGYPYLISHLQGQLLS